MTAHVPRREFMNGAWALGGIVNLLPSRRSAFSFLLPPFSDSVS